MLLQKKDVSEKLGVPVQFAPDCAKAGDAAAALKPGVPAPMQAALALNRSLTSLVPSMMMSRSMTSWLLKYRRKYYGNR